MVPSYYLRYFYAHDEVVTEMRTKPSRAAEVARMEKELLTLYADPALDEKPALLAKRGGAYYSEAAVDLAAALLRSAGPQHQVVNTLNNGTLLPPRRRGDRSTGSDHAQGRGAPPRT